MFTLIAAVGRNLELGKNGGLLWHLPTDLSFFKETTTGHRILMGRKTFESLGGRLLPERTHLVLSASKTAFSAEVEQLHSIEEVLEQYAHSEEEVFVIGGATVYEELLPYANRMLLTHVDAAAEADVFFPEFPESEWQISFVKEFVDEGLDCCILEYVK